MVLGVMVPMSVVILLGVIVAIVFAVKKFLNREDSE